MTPLLPARRSVPFHSPFTLQPSTCSAGVTPRDDLTCVTRRLRRRRRRAVFEPFGETDFISIEKDAAGRSAGCGYVQYRQTQHAVLAVSQLNGLELVGQALRVTMVGRCRLTLSNSS